MRPRDTDSEKPGATHGVWRVEGPAKSRGGGRSLLCVCMLCGARRTLSKTYLKTASVRCWQCKPRIATKARDPALLDGGPWGHLRDRAKRGADARKIPFELTRAEMKQKADEQSGECALTGVPLSFIEPRTASLDRKDSKGIYTYSNIQWVHKNINIAKHTLSNSEFIGMCFAVAAHCLATVPIPQGPREKGGPVVLSDEMIEIIRTLKV